MSSKRFERRRVAAALLESTQSISGGSRISLFTCSKLRHDYIKRLGTSECEGVIGVGSLQNVSCLISRF